MFDSGKTTIDFRNGIITEGLSKVVKLPPLSIPTWLSIEIDNISKLQANSKAAVVRQLLVEAVKQKRKAA